MQLVIVLFAALAFEIHFLSCIAQFSARLFNDKAINKTIPVTEYDALYDLYEATEGWNWIWAAGSGIPWNFTNAVSNPCADHWQGVMCNETGLTEGLHVTQLVLSGHNLTGTVPASLGLLTELTHLRLINNSRLAGTLPDSLFCNMTSLIEVNLAGNFLNGTIPSSIQRLVNLEVLLLTHNLLSGRFPDFGANLTSLRAVSVEHNEMSGTIPDTLGSLQQLEFFNTPNNYFTGTLPRSLCQIKNISRINAWTNGFHGTVPACYGGLTRLTELQLDTNQLTGTIPPVLGQLSELQLLWLLDNRIEGSLPESITQLKSLTELMLSNNRLSGSIPVNIGNCTKLFVVDASNCSLTGVVPPSLGTGATSMLELLLSSNMLTGTIPESLGNFQLMTILHLEDNRISGTVPDTFRNLRAAQFLYLQNNALFGSLGDIFHPTQQPNLTTIQVSHNQLTGTLPSEIFLLPSLTTFVAVSNCFSGTLLTDICHNRVLSSLILDGVQNAPACRERLFPATSFKSYLAPDIFHGTIPACLFTMSNLTTLHISGNGLTGSLPELAAIGARLEDLTLSHNTLTGTIPRAFQETKWKNLDLSYNRFTGVLLDTFATFTRAALANSATLNLQNNRLSGDVPPTLIKAQNISMLGTNMFSCKIDKSDLPEHDNNRDNYDCDSSSFNVPYYVWVCLVAIVAVIGMVGIYNLDVAACFPSLKSMITWIRTWSLDDASLPRNFRYVVAVSDILCKISVWCTALVVVVLVPWYVAASHYYGTYDHQYAWTVSAAFLSGRAVTGVEMFFWLFLMIFLVASLARLIVQYDKSQSRQRNSTRPESLRIGKAPARPPLRRRIAVYTLYLLVNLFVVVSCNVAFVIVASYHSNALLFIAQVVLSFFKLFWNGKCTPLLIRFIANRMSRSTHDTAFVTVQVVIALFNNILVPCLVVAVVSPSCFYSVFYPPTEVTSSYVYEKCTSITVATAQCNAYAPQVQITSYDPPFRYDYQCSSSFVTYYAPTFVYLCLTATFFIPFAKVVGQHLHKRATPGTWWHFLLRRTVPRILHLIAPVYENRESNVGEGAISPKLPSYDTIERRVYFPYFDANLFIVTLITYLGILLTFGVVFPPLAVAMCVTMISVTWQAKLAVGRFLHQARELNALKFVDIIELECRGAVTLPKIRRSIFIIICFCCSFYAMFLFDSLSDAVGYEQAYWVMIVMPLFPLLIYFAIWLGRRHQGALTLDFDLSLAAADQRDGTEMLSMRKAATRSASTDSTSSSVLRAASLDSMSMCSESGKSVGDETTLNALQLN